MLGRKRLFIINALCVFLLFLATPPALADKLYVVRKGDTLTRLAAVNRLTVAQLADHNKLSRTAKLLIGQRLRIPSRESLQPGSRLSAALRSEIERAGVKPGRWKHIIIHHSGTAQGTLRGMDRYHRDVRHMENGLAYHFVIGNGKGMDDGEIAVAHRWIRQMDGGHLSSLALNKVSIGICLVGNFDKTKPTPKQLANLEALIDVLLNRCSLGSAAVKTHQQINPVYTRCPGRHFPTLPYAGTARAAK
jgi:LysM repeat protein